MHKLMTVLLLWWAAWISSHSELWSPSGSILILQSLSSCPLSLKLKCWQLPTNFCADVCRQILVNCQQILNEKWKIQKLNVLLRVWRVDSDPLLCSLAGHLQSPVFSDWASPGLFAVHSIFLNNHWPLSYLPTATWKLVLGVTGQFGHTFLHLFLCHVHIL